MLKLEKAEIDGFSGWRLRSVVEKGGMDPDDEYLIEIGPVVLRMADAVCNLRVL